MSDSKQNLDSYANSGIELSAVEGSLDAESTEDYVRKADADVKRTEAHTARLVAIVLICALVGSLPVYLIVAALVDVETLEKVDVVFRRWFDVVTPLVAAVVGGLFGIASRDARNNNRQTGA